MIQASLNHKMGFSSTEEPNPRYFEKRNGEDYLKPGLVADAADDRVNRISGIGSNTGCKRAAQTLMLQAQAELAKKLGKSADLDRASAGKSLAELFPAKRSNENQDFTRSDQGLDPKDFIPGDRVWMKNHKYSTVQPDGYEGSNVTYLGKASNGEQLFLHMDGGKVETLSERRQTVKGYSPGRGDPNILNYKFKDRYSPKVPPSLGP